MVEIGQLYDQAKIQTSQIWPSDFFGDVLVFYYIQTIHLETFFPDKHTKYM